MIPCCRISFVTTWNSTSVVTSSWERHLYLMILKNKMVRSVILKETFSAQQVRPYLHWMLRNGRNIVESKIDVSHQFSVMQDFRCDFILLRKPFGVLVTRSILLENLVCICSMPRTVRISIVSLKHRIDFLSLLKFIKDYVMVNIHYIHYYRLR